MENINTYNLTKQLVQNYKNLRKEKASTHKFLAKARNLFFVSKEFHLSESDVEFLDKEMDFLEKAYNKIFIKDNCFSNLTETELEDIKKNFNFFIIKYENYYEYLNFVRKVFGKVLIFMFSLIVGKESIQMFLQNQKTKIIDSNIIDIIFYLLFFLLIIYLIYTAFPQIIVNIQAKREILKEIEILIDKRISQLKSNKP